MSWLTSWVARWLVITQLYIPGWVGVAVKVTVTPPPDAEYVSYQLIWYDYDLQTGEPWGPCVTEVKSGPLFFYCFSTVPTRVLIALLVDLPNGGNEVWFDWFAFYYLEK